MQVMWISIAVYSSKTGITQGEQLFTTDLGRSRWGVQSFPGTYEAKSQWQADLNATTEALSQVTIFRPLTPNWHTYELYASGST